MNKFSINRQRTDLLFAGKKKTGRSRFTPMNLPILCMIILMIFSVSALSGCSSETKQETAAPTEEAQTKAPVFSPQETVAGDIASTENVIQDNFTEESSSAAGTLPAETTSSPDFPEKTAPTETTPQETSTPETETDPSNLPTSPLTIDDVAFIGDSRTLSLSSGGRLEYRLLPDSAVFATWGGELTQDSARDNARHAAAADRKLAVFWYGINDVQSDPGQTLAPQFIANYKAIIDLYRSLNPDGEIVILSILSTSVHEKDYYEGQEENIRTYNAALAELCAAEGYTYLDITGLFTGDDCLAANDYIHFSQWWYEARFLPEVLGLLGITSDFN